ncbi:MAG: MBL fold metallo-hydrolase [Gemmobacter sp.]
MNRLVTLGVKGGPSIRAQGAMPTSSLLELDGCRIVVDCGLGVARGLVQAGVPLRDLTTVFITHLHSDHLLELGPLIHTAWVGGLSAPVDVYGPSGIAVYWQGFMASMAYDNHLRVVDDGRVPLDTLVRVHEADEGPINLPGLRVTALRVNHPPVDVALAFRFDGTTSVTFSGDTTFFPPLAEFARGTDVLVHEAMLPAGIDAILQKTGGGEKLRHHLNAAHTQAPDAGRIAAMAGAGRLVLHHLVPVDDDRFAVADWQRAVARTYDGPCDVARDGWELPL